MQYALHLKVKKNVAGDTTVKVTKLTGATSKKSKD